MFLDSETQKLVRELAKNIKKPLLIDCDGLTALCGDPDIIKRRVEPTILTPHSGEMSRITNIPVKEIDEKKIDVLQNTSDNLGAVIVLKGAHTLIGYPGGKIFVNMSGNSGMASAGSGDVLTGSIAAMHDLSGFPLKTLQVQGFLSTALPATSRPNKKERTTSRPRT
jgi:NAD(P)H-hydrate epimerase